MATYFHHHHHHHNHHGDDSDIIAPQADGMQTFLLMNPNFVGYSDTHPPPVLHAPPPLPPQLVGVPLHSTVYPPPNNTAWTGQTRPMTAERESPRTQQGLSLTLSSHNHSYDAAVSGRQPPPANEQAIPGSSELPALQRMLMSSKYLKAAQELLDEVVNVNVNRVKAESPKKSKGKREAPPVAGGGAEEDKQELQMKKAKLITLLDEVEQRYRLYHQQMQIVVSSFEEVAGTGSARTYTAVALKTISNQFRSLRDAILGQIRASNKSLGVIGGEGEGGPRMRLFDHQIRQQRAIQQLGMIQNSAWRPQRGLPEKAVTVLRAWLFEHFLHPYPKDSDKIILAKQTGLTRSQVSNWFINARVRLWKPMIEEMYAEEVKEHQKNGSESKSSKQDQHEEHGPTSAIEEKDNVGDNKAKTDNHNSFIPPFTTNTENPSGFTFVGTSRAESDGQGSLKKQRNNEMLHFSDAEKQEECSMMSSTGNGFIGGLGSYPIGQMGRFDAGQFPQSFSGNGVSLTLGLPHSETLSLPDTNQDFLHNNQDIDQYRGRLGIGEFNGFGGVKAPNASHSRSEYGAQLLPDFVT